ncbi:MAG: acyltransferase family protein [Pseudomonadota bacterium]
MSITYRPEVDGLRAVAVVPVVFYHAGLEFAPGGFVGVDVFFVISGFLITSLILKDLDAGRFSLVRFYERRARRILPALVLVMLVSLPVAWLVLMPVPFRDYLESLLSALLFYSNFFFYEESSYFGPAADFIPFLHTWSLAIEEQYYIIFPVVMMLFWQRLQVSVIFALVVAFLASLTLSQLALSSNPTGAYFLPHNRAWELLAGTGLALWIHKQLPLPQGLLADFLAVIGLLMVLLAVAVYQSDMPFPGFTALMPVLGTALILSCATSSTKTAKLLGAKPFVSVGLVSYGFYLWHVPVFVFFRHRFGLDAFDEMVWVLIALALFLATISYWLVERPMRFKVGHKVFLGILSGAVATLLAIGFWQDSTVKDEPASLPTYQWAIKNGPREWVQYASNSIARFQCDEKHPEFHYFNCDFGDPNADQSLVVWGDSLTWSLLHGLHTEALKTGLRGRAIYMHGCPPIPSLTNFELARTCTKDVHEAILQEIETLPKGQTVLNWGSLAAALNSRHIRFNDKVPTSELLRSSIQTAVDRLKARDARFFVIEPGPIYDYEVVQTLLQSLRSGAIRPPQRTTQAHLQEISGVREALDNLDFYIRTSGFFCNDELCPALDASGDMIIYDRNHLSIKHSIRFAQFVMQRVGPESRP